MNSDGIPSLLKKEDQINDEEKKEYSNLNDVEYFKLKKKCSTTLAAQNFKVMTFTHINNKRKTTEDISEIMANLDINKTQNKKGVNPESMIDEAIQYLNPNDLYEDSDDDEEGSIYPKFKKIKIFNSD